jgi:hypothetical protein
VAIPEKEIFRFSVSLHPQCRTTPHKSWLRQSAIVFPPSQLVNVERAWQYWIKAGNLNGFAALRKSDEKAPAAMGRNGARLPPKQVCQIWF